jgi:hypothetical protein
MRMMKKPLLLFVTILILYGFSNCKKDEDKYRPGKENQQYKGTAYVVIRYYEYNPYSGQDEFIEEKHYNYNTIVFIKPPISAGGITESNPFSLQINPDRTGGGDEEGHVDISSSLIMTVSTGYLLLQYWNYTLAGEQVTGTLVDNHAAEASAANMIWAWDDIAGIFMTMSFSMADGATMNGTVTANAVSLNITGQSIDTYRKFTCQINAVPQ